MYIAGIIAVILIIYFYMIAPRFSCRQDMKAYNGMMWAHRGLHCIGKKVPENSMAAFKAAVKAGYGIELDVHLTKDKQLVVFHDDTLTRLCGHFGEVEEMIFKELQNFYLAGTAEKIPLLSEVLEYVNGRVPLLIEVKLPSDNPEICRYLVKELDQYQGRFLVQSFNCVVLRWLKKNHSCILRGQLSSNLTRSDKKPHYWLRFGVKHLLCNCICRPDFISYKWEDRKEPGLWINRRVFKTPTAVWTVRSNTVEKEAKKVFDMLIFEEIKK